MSASGKGASRPQGQTVPGAIRAQLAKAPAHVLAAVAATSLQLLIARGIMRPDEAQRVVGTSDVLARILERERFAQAEREAVRQMRALAGDDEAADS